MTYRISSHLLDSSKALHPVQKSTHQGLAGVVFFIKLERETSRAKNTKFGKRARILLPYTFHSFRPFRQWTFVKGEWRGVSKKKKYEQVFATITALSKQRTCIS